MARAGAPVRLSAGNGETTILQRTGASLVALAGATFAVGAASTTGLFAPLLPWADAANHVRPFLLVCSIVLLGVTWLPGAHDAARRWLLIITAANAILFAAPLLTSAGSVRGSALATSSGRTLKVVTFNMAWIDRPIDNVTSFLLSEAPDLILLQEVTPRHATALRSKLHHAYPHIHACTLARACSLMVLSRQPWKEAGEEHRANDKPEIIWVRFDDARFGALHISGVHTAWPFRPQAQAEQISTLVARAKSLQTPAIFAGDFNLTPWSYQMQRFQFATGMRRHAMFLRSWPTDGQLHLPMPSFLIDHVLSTPDIRTASIRIGPNLGSDHLPVVATLALP